MFINCPFDEDYASLLRPLLFSVIILGFQPRIASERADSGETRIEKICQLITDSRYSIHDLSRLRASKSDELYRLNMAFELGIDYGQRRVGGSQLQSKQFLILEKDRYEFQKAISDLAGVDIKKHDNEPEDVVRVVRNWFIENGSLSTTASPNTIWNAFCDFALDFYDSRKSEGFTDKDLNMMPVPEYINAIAEWTAANKHRYL